MVALLGAFLAMVPPTSASAGPQTIPTTVLTIYQSNYTTEHDNFTVAVKVADTTGIQFVYYDFCQLPPGVLCYSPVAMAAHPGGWYIGSTKSMSQYHGMTEGATAGFNITILYNDNSTTKEPSVPNTFTALTVGQTVTGQYMFQMIVSPELYGLSGVVNDQSSGVPIAGATVTLTPGNGTTATTSASGAYSFAGLLNGTYTVSVSQHGYRTMNQTVSVAGADAVQNLALTNSSTTGPTGGGGSGSSAFGGLSPMVIVAVALVPVVVVAVALLLWRRRQVGPSPGSSASTAPGDRGPEQP